MKQITVADRIKKMSVAIMHVSNFCLLFFTLFCLQSCSVSMTVSDGDDANSAVKKTRYHYDTSQTKLDAFQPNLSEADTYQWHVAALHVWLHPPPALLPLSVHLCSPQAPSAVVPNNGTSQFVHLHPSWRPPLSAKSGLAAFVDRPLLQAGRWPSQHW